MTIMGIIIAKADSRRLPRKNLRPFCGKSLLEWSLIQAKYSKYITRIVVVTNGQEVADIADKYGALVVMQPQEEIDKAEAEGQLGGPYSMNRGFDAAWEERPFNGVFCMLPTSPLRKPGDMDAAMDLMVENGRYPVLSMVPQKDMHLFKRTEAGAVSALFDNKGTYLKANGNIFFCTPPQFKHYMMKDETTFWKPEEIVEKQQSGEFTYTPFLNEIWQEWDVDSQEDLERCEYWMEKKILQGRGEDVYKEYSDHILSEYGFQQTAAGYNKGVENALLPFEYRNSFFNHLPLFLESMKNEEVDKYELVEVKKDGKRNVAKWWRPGVTRDCLAEKLDKPKPALIIGSGLSLDSAGPLLNRWKGAVFSSSSQANTLVYYGCVPSHVVAYDINTSVGELENVEGSWEDKKTVLVTHPGVNPRLIDWWKGKKLLFRSKDTQNHFMMNVLPHAYGDIIGSEMYLFSCSISAQMSLAKAMGYSPLIFVGCDFALTRATFYSFKDGKWEGKPGGTSQGDQKIITSANGRKTDALKVFYKRSVMCVWRIDHAQCLLAYPERSIISEMPGVNFESVIAYQGEGFEKLFLTDQQIEDAAERSLAPVNQFIVKFKAGGVKVVECGVDTPDWEGAMKQYLGLMNAAGLQQGQGEIIDIEANMERFRWLKGEMK